MMKKNIKFDFLVEVNLIFIRIMIKVKVVVVCVNEFIFRNKF